MCGVTACLRVYRGMLASGGRKASCRERCVGLVLVAPLGWYQCVSVAPALDDRSVEPRVAEVGVVERNHLECAA